MRTRFLVALGLALAGAPTVVRGDEWPQFRGPGGTGLSAEKQLPQEWGADKNVQWKVKIPGRGWSSPIVWGDKVFLTAAFSDKEPAARPGGGFGGPGGGGRGPGGGFGGPPQPGQILPSFFQERLNLSADQKKQLEALQKDVDDKVGKTLTDEQKKQLKEPQGGPGPGGGGGRGPGGFGGFPQPGQIMPTAMQERLKLTAEQKKQVEDLQKDVDGKLAKLLTEEQNKQLKEMREGFGRGGPGGGFGGPGGGFGRGGAPPDRVYRFEVYCLDRATGKVLWKGVALEAKPRIPTQAANTYASETPVTDGERVYAYFGMHGVYCFDFDGKLIWKKDLGAYPMVMGQGTASSPVLDGQRLFLQIDNEEKSFLVALDANTGDELWRAPRSERSNHCSPFVWKNKQRTELVANGSKVRSYDPATGKVLWELSLGGGSCQASPVGDDEHLYVGSSGRGGMGGFGGGQGRPGGGGAGGPPGGGRGGGGGGTLFAVKAGASGDITPKQGQSTSDGVTWSQPRAAPGAASPLVYQGYVYIVEQNGGMVSCFDAKTGKAAYTKERIPGARTFWASPWAYDGKVFCLDDTGTTHVLQAGPTFKVLGKNGLSDQFWASPAVAGGSLILRGVDNVYCIKQ